MLRLTRIHREVDHQSRRLFGNFLGVDYRPVVLSANRHLRTRRHLFLLSAVTNDAG